MVMALYRSVYTCIHEVPESFSLSNGNYYVWVESVLIVIVCVFGITMVLIIIIINFVCSVALI